MSAVKEQVVLCGKEKNVNNVFQEDRVTALWFVG